MIDDPFPVAVRENTAIILALCGGSGSGKTKSALELAVGLANGGDILVVDSEGGRARHYADEYRFRHFDWRAPYTPQSLGAVLQKAVERNITVVIVDSMSSEHEDEGGLCDMAEEELQKQRPESRNSAAAWAKPKSAHKHHVVRWLRTARCHVIFCCRASEKVKLERVNNRTVIVPVGWTPIAEKNLLFDVTTSLLFTADKPGCPQPIKLYAKHAPFFPPDQPVTSEAGRALAAWAAGAAAEPLLKRAEAAADGGTQNLREFYRPLSAAERDEIQPHVDALKARAAARDRPAGPPPSADSSPADDAGFPNAPPGDTEHEHAAARDLTQQPELQKGGRASGATRSAEAAPPRSFTCVPPQRRNGKFDWPATREALLTATGEIKAAPEVASWVEVQQTTLDLLPADDRRAVERALNEKVALMGMGDGQ